jgi:cytochrome c556
MIRIVATVAALALGATLVHAQNAGAITERKNTFKPMGAAMKEPGGMMKGEVPFDLAKVQATLKIIQEQSVKLKTVFPDDSKTGDTDALPAAFEKKTDLFARFDKLGADAKDAAAAITDEASFKANWGKVGANCGGCHKEYKKPAA